jgi:hypothetical protein
VLTAPVVRLDRLANHRAAVALTVAHFTLVKMRSSIRMTPATKAEVTNWI